MRMNSSKNDGVGQRQVDMAKKFHDAGLLSKQGLDAVLALRVEIYHSAGHWFLMEVVARKLWKCHPEQPIYWTTLAWAVRRLDSIKAAHSILLDAANRFPGDAMTHFNLGCYSCQLGDIKQAKTRDGKALELDAKFKLLALDGADLEPLWKEIEEAK